MIQQSLFTVMQLAILATSAASQTCRYCTFANNSLAGLEISFWSAMTSTTLLAAAGSASASTRISATCIQATDSVAVDSQRRMNLAACAAATVSGAVYTEVKTVSAHVHKPLCQ